MEGKISLIGNFATDWIRYSDYEYKKSSTGEVYITPTKQATFSMYNPFNVAEDLLMDVLNLGDQAQQIDTEESMEDLKRQLLIFVKKYGLMGFISGSVYNRNIIGEEHVLMIENNFIKKEKIMTENDYVSMFIPFADEDEVFFKKYKNCVDVVKREDSPKFYGKRPLVMDLIFSRFYCEKIDWIIEFVRMLSTHFTQLLMYKHSLAHLTEGVTIMAGKFRTEKISFTINHLDKTFIAWEFDSLKSTIETIYGFAVTDDTTLVSRCSHCKKAYISNNTRSKYCSPSCRNCANVQKSREKNKC